MGMIKEIKRFLKDNKNISYIGIAVLCCVLVVSGLLLLMPEGHATEFTGYGEGNTPAAPKELILQQNADNRWISTMSGGVYYLLDGEGKTLNSGIDITISGGVKNIDGYYDVYLTLKDVNINLATDVSGITFQFTDADTRYEPTANKNIFDESRLNRNKVRVHLYLMGDSSIKGVAGAQSPLIEAENYNFVTETYYSQGDAYGRMGDFVYYSQHIEIIIESAQGQRYRDTLTLTTGEGSYGAAIGGRGGNPIKKKLESVGISESAYENLSLKYEPYLHFNYYDSGTFLADLSAYNVPTLEYGAAEVTIKSGVVNITGRGYGAGIGNGGYQNTDSKMVTFPTLYGKMVTASAQSNTSAVRIEDGTVSVKMTENSKGSCFVNGAVGENIAEDGLVTIMGGSVYLERQDNASPYKNAINDYKDPLYAFVAHYDDDAQEAQAAGNAILNSDFDLENIWETENEDYKYVITKFVENGQPEDTYTGAGIDYLNTYVKLTSGYGDENKYKFTGYKHDNDDKLYFYLPATRYNLYGLTIRDNVGTDARFTPSYEIAILNSEQMQVPDKYDTYAFSPYNEGTTIKQTKYILVKIEGTPSYCTGITGAYIQNGISTPFENVIQIGDYWYLCVGEVKGDMVIDITYSLGNYNIVYNYGLLPQDSGAANDGSIVNRNSRSVECGTEYTLLVNDSTTTNVSWRGHTFEGWYADSDFTTPITVVSSDVVGDTKYVYAKWSCDVIYKIENGMGRFLSTGTDEIRKTVQYGESFDFMADANLPDTENDIDMGESENLFEFKGWDYNGHLYNKGDGLVSQITVSKDTYITATFERSGYFVYITATYGDDETTHRDIKDFLGENTDDSFRMDFSGGERRNLISNSANENGYYWSTSLLNSEYVTVTLVPKTGYRIKGKSVTDAYGNAINLIANDVTTSDNKNQFSFSMDGRNKDIYISVHFDVEEYDITYYDTVNGGLAQIDGTPNPDTYTIESADIVFERPARTDRDRYWRFLGFKEMGRDELITGIPKNSRTGNLTLIAQWEEVQVYDINIDEGIGSIKAYVGDEQVTAAAEGETVTLKVTANPGIRLKAVEYSWKADSGLESVNKLIYDVTNTTETVTFTMPAAEVNVSGDFEAIQYVITYLNLNGAENVNPSLYTVFDSFKLAAPVKEGMTFKGWKLIIPNGDTADDAFDVKMTDIDRIENRIGNLMIYADWEENEDVSSVYYAFIDDNIINGQIELTKTEASKNEYVFVKVSVKDGYRLSSLVYTPSAVNERIRISPIARYSLRSTAVDISINQIADGIYYFVMPDSDVEVTAEFEPVIYSISYVTDGGQHVNAEQYTVEDNIILSDAIKDGYIFKGWYNEAGEEVRELHYATGNMILSAKWEKTIENTDNPTDIKDGDSDADEDNTTKGDENNNNNGNSNAANGTGNSTGNNSGSMVNGNGNIENININVSGNGSFDTAGSQAEPSIDKKPNTYVTGNITTGDSVDVTRLIIICVICGAVLLLLVIPKKKNQDEDENQEKK